MKYLGFPQLISLNSGLLKGSIDYVGLIELEASDRPVLASPVPSLELPLSSYFPPPSFSFLICKSGKNFSEG